MNRFLSQLKARATMLAAVLAVIIISPSLSSCSEDETTSAKEYTQGVVLPSNGKISRSSTKSSMDVAIYTENAYSIDVDNTAMLSITRGQSATKGGSHSVGITISANTTDKERVGNVYITVSGYSRIKIFEITQNALKMSEEVKWVDKRLREEYYWLDEYNQKLGTFDTALPFDEYLSSALLSLTTNVADGGINGNGSRYIYSYISREPKNGSTENNGSSSASKSEIEQVSSFGLILASTIWAWDEEANTSAFAVDHVFADSPAEKAGIIRGDIITHVNGQSIPNPYNNNGTLNQANYDIVNKMWQDLQFESSSSISLTAQHFVDRNLENEGTSYILNAAQYYENPIADYQVLELSEEMNPGGHKIGYMSYIGFEYDYNRHLVDAMKALAAEGVTDMVLDLRINSGGSVVSSIYLASMLLDESYVGKIYAKLVRNKANKHIGDELCLIEPNYVDPNTYAEEDLPNLGIKKLWVITSYDTASASEMVIQGLRGLDVEVELIGTTTEGKNCGMDVISNYPIGDYLYTYAPITFINENAKGFSDYADGIAADVDLDRYYTMATKEEQENDKVVKECGRYPMPVCEWGNVMEDIALREAVARINGTTALVPTPIEPEEGEGTEGEGSEGEGSEGEGSTEAAQLRPRLSTRAGGSMQPLRIDEITRSRVHSFGSMVYQDDHNRILTRANNQ